MHTMSGYKLTCVENWSPFFVSHFYRSWIDWKQFFHVQQMCSKIILQQISIVKREKSWLIERKKIRGSLNRSLLGILILNNMQLYKRVSMEAEQQHKSLSLAVKLGEREREKKLTLIFKLCLEDPRSILSVCQPNTAEDCRKLFRVVKYRSYLAASFFPDLRQCSRMPSRSFA